MTIIYIIGAVLTIIGVFVTLMIDEKNSKIYHYGSVRAKIVDKRSERQFFECGEYDKIIKDKITKKMFLNGLNKPCEDPLFPYEQPLYPIYEYTYDGKVKTIQSYTISYAPVNAYETIHLDQDGKVNDAYKAAGLNAGTMIILYGVSIIIAEFIFKCFEAIPDFHPKFEILFCFFGNIGIAVLLSALYDLLSAVRFKKIDAEVVYEYTEAQYESDDDGRSRITYFRYPVIHYVNNDKEVWHRTNVGSNYSSKIKRINVRENTDGMPVDSKTVLEKIFLGIIWISLILLTAVLDF